MLYDAQVHFHRVEPLGWFLELTHISLILRLERGSFFNMFHLLFIYMIINVYSDLNHFCQFIRSFTLNDLILYIILETSIKGVH
jgi:hypothetical protein